MLLLQRTSTGPDSDVKLLSEERSKVTYVVIFFICVCVRNKAAEYGKELELVLYKCN